MGNEPAGERASGPRHAAFLLRLYRQAAHRWFILLIALAFLLWLGVYAGRVRNPDAVKREWAVLASRVLAGAAGFFLTRLLLFSYEERVPVLLFDLRSLKGGNGTVRSIGGSIRRLQDRGYEVVPLSDVVEFVRDRRYVPKKCLGVVIEAGSMGDLAAIDDVFPEAGITVLLPADALEADPDPKGRAAIPPHISLGISLVDHPDLPDTAALKSLLEHFSKKAVSLTGSEMRYVRVNLPSDLDLRGLLKGTAYTCFLDSRGLNRFGDEPHMLRLFDTTAVMDSRHAMANLPVYIGLFQGRYYLWPAAAVLRLFGAGPEGI